MITGHKLGGFSRGSAKSQSFTFFKTFPNCLIAFILRPIGSFKYHRDPSGGTERAKRKAKLIHGCIFLKLVHFLTQPGLTNLMASRRTPNTYQTPSRYLSDPFQPPSRYLQVTFHTSHTCSKHLQHTYLTHI